MSGTGGEDILNDLQDKVKKSEKKNKFLEAKLSELEKRMDKTDSKYVRELKEKQDEN